MKLPLKWLQEYVEIPSSVEELSNQFTAIGHMQDHQPQEIAGDVVLDLEVRQNRSDCLSVVGLAREIAASLEKPLKLPNRSDAELPTAVKDGQVEITDPSVCYRFHTLHFDEVQIAESPKWLSQRLEAYGIKSINNLVDITNYVMVELGEPLHAFDKNLLKGNLKVRQAQAGEKIEVLGGRTIELTPQEIVIADNAKAVAIGGIIGGLETAVSSNTTSILLEAATYNQAYIRRTSLRHSLRTEASLRHEKFLHPELTEAALQRAAALIQELCHAKLVIHTDTYPNPLPATKITLSISRLQKLTGIKISIDESSDILERLGLKVEKKTDDQLTVEVPYFRTDLVLEEDIIEEVLRIHGYDKIPDTLPTSMPPKEIASETFVLEEQIRDILVGFGFDEVITEPLVKEDQPLKTPVTLQNSLNSDKTMLRTTLKYSLHAALTYQRKHKKGEVLLFEVGRVYSQEKQNYLEEKMLAGIIYSDTANLLHTKGYVEALLARLGKKYHDGLAKYEKLSQNTCYFEVSTDQMIGLPAADESIQTSLPQIVLQDLSLLVPNDVKVGQIIDSIRNDSDLIYKVELGELPRKQSETQKSVFLKLQYLAANRQLSMSEIEPIREKILSNLAQKFEAKVR